MKVFISWSGKDSVSQKVAIELSTWLPTILQSVETWISTDITSGDRWNDVINKNLSETGMGIICVTKENIKAPWLNFEAGAIAKGLSKNKVIPLLINLKPSDLVDSPLIQFQAKGLDKDSIKKLLLDINSQSEISISNDKIIILFEHLWNELKEKIEEIIIKTPKILNDNDEREKRPAEDILEEVLSLTREMRIDLSYLKQMESKMTETVLSVLPNKKLINTWSSLNEMFPSKSSSDINENQEIRDDLYKLAREIDDLYKLAKENIEYNKNDKKNKSIEDI